MSRPSPPPVEPAPPAQLHTAAAGVLSPLQLWGGTILLILAFFYLQSHFILFQGYQPFRQTAFTHYGFRTLVAGLLFFAPLLLLLPPRQRDRAGAATLICALAMVLLYFAYSIARRDNLAPFNDRSEALSVAVRAIARGEFPYAIPTSLGNPISPLPISFLLAAPAEFLFRRPELMNVPIFALCTVLLCLDPRSGRPHPAWPLIATGFLLSPLTLAELAWGSDLLWGTTLLIAGLWLEWRYGRSVWPAVLITLALGTRPSYLPLALLWLVMRLRRGGWRLALRDGLVMSVLGLAIVLPFALWNPGVFFDYSPFGLTMYKMVLPWPAGDNAFTDVLNRIMPTEMARARLLSASSIGLSLLFGWRMRGPRGALLGMAAVTLFMLLTLGDTLLVDYFCWIVPLALAAVAWPAAWPPLDAHGNGSTADHDTEPRMAS